MQFYQYREIKVIEHRVNFIFSFGFQICRFFLLRPKKYVRKEDEYMLDWIIYKSEYLFSMGNSETVEDLTRIIM